MKNKMATISELHAIPYKDKGEPLINLKEIISDICLPYRRIDLGLQSILVRKCVAEKLQKLRSN